MANIKENVKEIVISRAFNAPIEKVYAAWTRAEHLANWYAPTGCIIHIESFDFKKGGMFHHCIKSETAQFKPCWCLGTYLEIIPNKKLVYTLCVSNEKAEIISAAQAGMHHDWPDETTVTVLFEERDDKTIVVLCQTVSEELAKQTGAYPSWLIMFDRLHELITS